MFQLSPDHKLWIIVSKKVSSAQTESNEGHESSTSDRKHLLSRKVQRNPRRPSNVASSKKLARACIRCSLVHLAWYGAPIIPRTGIIHIRHLKMLPELDAAVTPDCNPALSGQRYKSASLENPHYLIFVLYSKQEPHSSLVRLLPMVMATAKNFLVKAPSSALLPAGLGE